MNERKRVGSGAGNVDRRDNRDTNTVAVNYNILPKFSPRNGGWIALVVCCSIINDDTKHFATLISNRTSERKDVEVEWGDLARISGELRIT